jgi:DNA mismatch repair protein MSH4
LGRHPIRERFGISRVKFVPNDTFIYNGNNLQIVTGPNASGKSTYLRQVPLLAILAQMGCFVPAEYASFRLMDKLLTQLSTEDDIGHNASTFMVEMRNMAFIMCALCERLLRTKAFILLATHFTDLAEVLEVYPNVCNMHLSCDVSVCVLAVSFEIELNRND